MPGTLFPLKLFSFFSALVDTGAFQKMAHAGLEIALDSPDDGMTRLLLCSPDVQNLVAATVPGHFRIRIAVPKKMDIVSLSDFAQLEVYGSTGLMLKPPVKLTRLDNLLASAVQLELFHALLLTKGINIALV